MMQLCIQLHWYVAAQMKQSQQCEKDHTEKNKAKK